MRWVMLYDPPPPREWDMITADIDASLRGAVIAESPGIVGLASEQHVGLFVRPLLPRIP